MTSGQRELREEVMDRQGNLQSECNADFLGSDYQERIKSRFQNFRRGLSLDSKENPGSP
jgi:hypothetical protein